MNYLLISLLLSTNVFAIDKILSFQAEYEVPVENAKLKPYSTFKLNDYQVIILDSGNTYLKFKMPKELTGSNQEVTMSLVEDLPPTKKLEGPLAKANCNGKWNALECSFRFYNLDFNKKELNKSLSKYPFREKLRRKQVAQSFSSDPIGFSRVIPE